MLIAQSCWTLCDPMDCSPPRSSVRGILQARILEWGLPFPSPGDLPDPGIKPGLLHYRRILYHLSHQESPKRGTVTEEVGRWQVERKKKGFPDQEENPGCGSESPQS